MEKGSYIKKLREEKGISQRELGELINISNTEISKIESGERQEPSPYILKSIGKALGVNYLVLFIHYGYVDNDVLEGIIEIKETKTLNNYTNSELIGELSRRLK